MLFEIVISTIKHSNNQSRTLIKRILNMQNFHLKNTNNKKKHYFEEEYAENRNIPKEIGQF